MISHGPSAMGGPRGERLIFFNPARPSRSRFPPWDGVVLDARARVWRSWDQLPSQRGAIPQCCSTRSAGRERETGLEALKVDAMPNGTDRERQNGGWRHRKGNMTKRKNMAVPRGLVVAAWDGSRPPRRMSGAVVWVIPLLVDLDLGEHGTNAVCRSNRSDQKCGGVSRVLLGWVGARCAEVLLDVVICCVVCVCVCVRR